jgi:hypothetical protein
MTSDSSAGLEGSILTPTGWGRGQVEPQRPRHCGDRGATARAGGKTERSLHPARIHRSPRSRGRGSRLAGRRRRHTRARALPYVLRHDGHRADHRHRAGRRHREVALSHRRRRRQARGGRGGGAGGASRGTLRQPGEAGRHGCLAYSRGGSSAGEKLGRSMEDRRSDGGAGNSERTRRHRNADSQGLPRADWP